MKILLRFLPLLLLLSLTACIKGKEAAPFIPTPSQQIAGNWQLRAYTADSAFNGTDTSRTDVFAKLPLCRQDDVFEFGKDGILLLQEGAANCNPATGSTVALGYWEILEKPLKLVMDDPDLPANTDTLNVETLNSTTLMVNNQSTFLTPAGAPVQVQSRKTYILKK